ncbi:MAG: glycosyltransferase [Thermoanaerobaculia bacterium]
MPPVRSGIADYSADLLPHLIAGGGVRVLGLPDQPVDPELEERFAVVPAEEARPAGGWAGEAGRLPLYQMGNNRYHRAVQAMALERPGVLVLHDLVLHHLVSEETLGVRDFDAYRRRLTADHGWVGREAARPRAWGAAVEAMLFELPAHRTLLRRQRGVLVHNRWAARRIREEDPEVPVQVVPMGIPLPPPLDPAAGRRLRRRFGVPEDAPVLGSFGFQTPIKRTAVAVRALTTPELSRAHLLVVGESPGGTPGRGADLLALARELGVADRVHETGFVPFEEFGAAIAACDLALNLRYPTAGETSASLLRILALGRAAVVSDHAQFAELPGDAVVQVPLGSASPPAGGPAGAGDEAAALARELAGLLAAPERLAAMGEAAREHVRRNHAPEDAARAVWEACQAFAHAPPPGDRPAAPPPPTSITREALPGRVALEDTLEPWPAGGRRRLALRLANHGPARWLAAHRGPGGIALQVSLVTPDGEDVLADRPWLPLPRDLDAGETHRFEIALRRPPGPATLTVATRLLGGSETGAFEPEGWGGPRAEWRIGWP